MFDKYSKRNTKSMSNKRNCLKHLFLISLIILIFASCSPSSNGISETASLLVEAHQKGISVASIAPTTPEPVKYVISLIQGDNTQSWEFEPEEIDSGSVQIDDIKVGTYDLYIAGYSVYEEGEEGKKIQVVEGKQQVTIKPNTSNIATITLSYLSTGTGTISLKIDWSGLTQKGNLISDALDRKRIGFLAFYADGDENSSNDIAICGNPTEETLTNKIKWASSEDFTNKLIDYTESGLTANKETEEIYFRIYSEIDGDLVVIAETFRTNLTVYPNLTSVPDANDKYNFTLSDNNIMNYLRNVSSPEAKAINDSTLQITWKNPKYSSNIYPITVTVKAKDIETGSVKATETVDYSSYTENGETTLDGLSSDKVYSIWFEIKGQIGYSADVALISNARPRVPVTAIAFDTTDNDFDYISGETIEFKALITPEEATNKEYTVSVENNAENVEINNHSVKFNKAGEYSIVLTSSDSGVKTEPKKATVHLTAPGKPSVSAASDDGITITWTEVADADKYKIIRTANGSHDREFTTEGPETTYTDNYEISLGTTYSYSIVALMDEYESCSSAESEKSEHASTSVGSITINPAPALESGIDFSSSFDLIDGTSINDENPSITINVAELSGATYEWRINGIFVTNNKNLTINSETNGISKDSSKTANELTLIVKANGKTVSGSCNFYYESRDDFEIVSLKDVYEDNMVVYGLEPEQLTLTYSRNDITPVVNWSSSDPSVVKIDPNNGKITSVSKGNATITAKATNNGITRVATIGVESYIPATNLTVTVADSDGTLTDRNFVFLPNQNGIEGLDEKYTSLKITATAESSNSASDYSGEIEWTISDSNGAIATYNTVDGMVTPIGGGSVNITATINNNINGIKPTVIPKEIKILEIQIRTDGETNYAGNENGFYYAGTSQDKTISLYFVGDVYNSTNFKNAQISNWWCFNENNDTKIEIAWGGLGLFSITNNEDDGNYSAILNNRTVTGKKRIDAVIRYDNKEIARVWCNSHT